jgi:NAD(P)-dependent dehydrogenase (short-subunit alcohol dehydrogenase family)
MSARVALVTGGTRGLGAALSLALVKQGVTVAAAYRADDEAAAHVAGEAGPRLEAIRCDVTDPGACADLVNEVVTRHGRIDHLVNNAGGVREAKLAAVTPDDWNRALALNLSSAFYLSQACLPWMKQQRFGRILNVSSISATMGTPFQVDYAAAKSGLIGLTRSVARAAARSSITANCLVLGGFRTDLLDGLTLTDRETIERAVPVGRYGEAREFVHAALALLDDDASYVTGAVLVVDGGFSMGG